MTKRVINKNRPKEGRTWTNKEGSTNRGGFNEWKGKLRPWEGDSGLLLTVGGGGLEVKELKRGEEKGKAQ